MAVTLAGNQRVPGGGTLVVFDAQVTGWGGHQARPCAERWAFPGLFREIGYPRLALPLRLRGSVSCVTFASPVSAVSA